MTGYGRFEKEEQGKKVTIEMSTVNHRYCDVNVRLPKSIYYLEEEIKKHIKKKIARGKLEISIYYTYNGEDATSVAISEDLCRAYIEKLREIGSQYGLTDDLCISHVLAIQDLFVVEKKSIEKEEIKPFILEGVAKAVQDLVLMREAEGEELKQDILNKLEQIGRVLEKIEGVAHLVVVKYEEKLRGRLEKLLREIPIDEAKLATELAVFADKACIDEEIIRLKSHIKQFTSILEEDEAVGRKMDFLMQEMNREANTIASKTNDYMIANYAVELKTEMEKIREQIQNIE
jgi:uncharacterized protein (TIGR00255 family)